MCERSGARRSWTLETVPSGFWERIEGAGGSVDRYEEALSGLSEGELRSVYAQFMGLADDLIRGGFERFSATNREEETLTLKEIANWVITQGRARYEEVRAHPERFPERAQIRRPIFAGAVVHVYSQKFGRFMADA